MRLSVNPQDKGYKAWKAAKSRKNCVVRLDGKVLYSCVTADTATGMVVFIEKDDDGKIVLNSKRDSVKMKQAHGVVTIDFEKLA